MVRPVQLRLADARVRSRCGYYGAPNLRSTMEIIGERDQMLFNLITESAGASMMMFPVAFTFVYKGFFEERKLHALWILAGYILTSVFGGFVLYMSVYLVGAQNVLNPNEEYRMIFNVALPLCLSAFVATVLCSRFPVKTVSAD